MLNADLYASARALTYQPTEVYEYVISELSDADRRAVELALHYDWEGIWRRDKQKLPEGEYLWVAWICGRGFGKTRLSMELVRKWAEKGEDEYIAIVAATHLTLQRDLIFGPSGIMNVSPPWFRPSYHPTKGELRWPRHPVTGVRMRATLMSGDKPDRIRGDEVSKAVLDELPTWQDPNGGWMNVELMLRRGTNCLGVITCTLKRTGAGSLFSRDLLWGPRGKDGKRHQREDLVIVQGSTDENDALDAKRRAQLRRRFAGTADEVTELEGGLPKEAEGALWTVEILDEFRVETLPPDVVFERVVTAIDPTRQAAGLGDLCGIITGARGSDGHVYIYADNSLQASPDRWMDEGVVTYERNRSDYGVYEQNRLGEDNVKLLAEKARIHKQRWNPVTARGKKRDRAEPVATLYKQGRVHHIGFLTEAEDEMVGWDPDEPEKQQSPNRIDALAHLVKELLLSEKAQRKPLVIR